MAEKSKARGELHIVCTPELEAQFKTYCQEHKLSYGEGLAKLFAPTEAPIAVEPMQIIRLLQCTERELAEIAEASTQAYNNFPQMLKSGFLAQIRRANSTGISLSASGDVHVTRGKAKPWHYTATPPVEVSINLDNPQERMRVKGAGYLQVARTVERLMETNIDAKNANGNAKSTLGISCDILYLGVTSLMKESGADYAPAKQYCTDHAEQLLQHNYEMGLMSAEAGSQHNRQRAEYLRGKAQALGVAAEVDVNQYERLM